MFVALAGYLAAYIIKQPASIGIILAGIVVGPSLLGLVTYTDFVASFAQLGAVVLLFTIGLEFEVEEIAKIKYLLIALAGVVVPWGLGFAVALAFHYNFNTSVFIGTAISATSIAITATVLEELGRLQTPAARAILGAAIIDDVLALLALSVSEQLVSGSILPIHLLIDFGKAFGFIFIAVVPVRLLLRRFIIRFNPTKVAEKYPEAMFAFAMVVAFLFSMAAGLAGLSPVVGSFLAGVCFTGTLFKRSDIFREGAHHLKVIFASIFFISLGVLLDTKTLTPGLLLFTLALAAVAIVSKFLGCGISARLLGFGGKEASVIGVGMAPRGEVTMVVALIGLSQGYINRDIYSALILMSLLTTLLAPLILRNWLYRPGKAREVKLV
ncbi:MAG: cation:proton antiporter [Chloroflexi bacterium]|nr:cation:proton antiporter [Chloroflexota bacterium]